VSLSAEQRRETAELASHLAAVSAVSFEEAYRVVAQVDELRATITRRGELLRESAADLLNAYSALMRDPASPVALHAAERCAIRGEAITAELAEGQNG